MTLDIGVCSYRNPEKLKRCLDSIRSNTRTPSRIHIWHNDDNHPDSAAAYRVAQDFGPFSVTISSNVGYAGAVNGLIAASSAPYFAYLDNDAEVQTPGWDERFIDVLENNPECGQVFPGAGHFGFHNGRYHECLWSAGYFWMMRRDVLPKLFASDDETGLGYSRFPCSGVGADQFLMDQDLGHHDEVCLMVRLRLAGFQIGCVPDVQVLHHETSTQSPESAKRIHRGVVNWMNKYNKYFVGDAIKYPNPDPDSGECYDPRTLRYTDWPPCALYLERWTLAQFPDWNSKEADPDFQGKGYRVVNVPGVGEMDAIEILKPKGYYRGRAI